MQQQQADQVSKWINKCETFDRWIDSETKELETLLTFPDDEAILDKVIEEELAIRVRLKPGTPSPSFCLDGDFEVAEN